LQGRMGWRGWRGVGVRGDRGGGGVGAVGRGAGNIGSGPAALVDPLEETEGVLELRGGTGRSSVCAVCIRGRFDSIRYQQQNHQKQAILLLFALFSVRFFQNVCTTGTRIDNVEKW